MLTIISSMIYIINYGIGNLGSVKNMLKKVGVEAEYATTSAHIQAATRLILPGVGAFDSCIQALNESGMLNSLTEKVIRQKTPLLGICVGYQMLTHGSEEGKLKGLGWLDADTIRFQDPSGAMKIPHMGWNYIVPQNNHPLAKPFQENAARAYFVHSYNVQAKNPADVILQTEYIRPFASGMSHGSVMGVQFHPEKSHRYGMALFKAFTEMPL